MPQKDKTLLGLLLALAVILASRFVSASFFQLALIDLLLLVFVPALFIKLSGRSLQDFGFCLGDLKLGLKYAIVIFALALPLMFYGSQMPSFRDYYPIWKPAYKSLGNLILYESSVCVMLFSTEFFYRGFLLFTLDRKTRYGNLVHAIAYALVHVGKPFLEVPYSFFAGLVFGAVDLRCKSILPSFLMHFLGNIAFDLLIIYSKTHGL